VITVSDIQPHIEKEFGSRLEPAGFQRLGERKWVRSQKQPIRELFVQEFCRSMHVDFEDRVQAECIRHAESKSTLI
jgi:hypothetical protein